MARLFYAIPLPSAVQQEVAGMAASVLPAHIFRTVPAANIHITLVFLGEIPDEDVTRSVSILDSLEESAQQFGGAEYPGKRNLVIGGAGAFPRLEAPRVVWIGVPEGTHLLTAVHGTLVESLTAANLPFDRKPFRPHVTIAYRRRTTGELRRVTRVMQEAFADFRRCISPLEVVLYESRLSSRGAIHTALRRVSIT